jgi:cbb3-type cytochrome oxidase maturation protein
MLKPWMAAWACRSAFLLVVLNASRIAGSRDAITTPPWAQCKCKTMNILYVSLLALMLLAVAAWALIWAIRTCQFDDLDSQGWSVVLDDDQKPPAEKSESAEKSK